MYSTKGVTVLLLGVLISAGLHLLRLLYAIQNWSFLKNLLGWVVVYILVSGFSLFILSIVMIFLILNRNKNTFKYLSGYILILIVFYWIDRLGLSIGVSNRNIPFVIALQLLTLIVYWLLMRSKGVQVYFGAKHDK